MFEQYAHEIVVVFMLLVGIAGCLYGLNPDDKYAMYRKSDEHYNDEDCT